MVEGNNEGTLVLAHPLLPLLDPLLVPIQLSGELLDSLHLPRQVILVVVALFAAMCLRTFSFLLEGVVFLIAWNATVLLLHVDLGEASLRSLLVVAGRGGDGGLVRAHLWRSLYDDAVSRDLPP